MEAWGRHEISDLLQTVADGLPAGSALILEVGDRPPFFSRPMVGAPAKGERVSELLLDGQQRLTALWRALRDDYPDAVYFVENPSGPDQDNGDNWGPFIKRVTRWTRDGKTYPLWVDRPEECWAKRDVPVRLLRPDQEAENEAKEWARIAADGDLERILEIRDAVDPLRNRFARFNLPYLSLDVDTPQGVAIDVFVKMNTRTVKLTTFDIVVAQIEAASGESLHDLVEGLRRAAGDLEAYTDPQDVVLPAAALLQDRSPSAAGQLGLEFERVVADWPMLAEGARRTVEFLEQERIWNSQTLATESILPPLIALWASAPEGGDALGNARILLRRYLWRSFFTERYDRGATTAALQDYRALRGVLAGEVQQSEVPCFDNNRYPLPQQEELLAARWPKYKDRLARAVLAVILRGGAYDVADGAEVSREHLVQREYHHLYPVAWFKSQERAEDEAHRALNCVLLTWKTNRTIAAQDPNRYLLARCHATALGEDEIRRRLASHVVEYDWLSNENYDDLLNARASTILRAAAELCQGRPWRPEID